MVWSILRKPAAVTRPRESWRVEPVRGRGDLECAANRDLYDYWQSKVGDRPIPDRADIDPLEMVPWLPHLLLVEIGADRRDVRFRLIGTWVVDRVGRDDTGMTVADLGLTEGRRQIRDSYLEAARLARPSRRGGEFHDRSGVQKHLRAERVLLPLTDGGPEVAMILCAIYFIDD